MLWLDYGMIPRYGFLEGEFTNLISTQGLPANQQKLPILVKYAII